MAKKKKKQTAEVGINMTPMIDMVFQLMIFFLLVSQFASAEIDPKVELPDLDWQKSLVTEKKPEHRLVINAMADVSTEEKFTGRSAPLDYIKVGALDISRLGRESGEGWRGVLKKVLEQERQRLGEGAALVVVIRAHRALAWREVKRLFAAVAAEGIANIHLGGPMGQFGVAQRD